MYGELGYAAAYVHLFYVLCCVERYVDMSAVSSFNLLIPILLQSCSHCLDTELILGCILVFLELFIALRNVTARICSLE
jgi:hypothetical protein